MKRGLFLLLLFVASFGSIAAISLHHKACAVTPYLPALTQAAVKTATAVPAHNPPPEDYTLGFTLLRF